MSEVQNIAIDRAIKLLEATGCEYAIVTKEGETYSNGLEIAEKEERQRAPLKYAYGEISGHYKPKIDINAPVGSIQTVSFGKFTPEEVRGGLCAWLSREWGKDSYVSNIAPDFVEILRVA